MFSTILIACALVGITVVIHVVGIAVLLIALKKRHALSPMRFWPITRLLIAVVMCLLLFHLVEIAVWGLLYLWQEGLPGAEAAFYFSGVTYATIGYGDLVLAEPLRILAPIEGLTGILMCGLSASFFFAVVNRIHHEWQESAAESSTVENTRP